ncbi:MAG: hypothetical protein ABWK00_03425 [Desulfurococcaceae archaeon]
MSEIPREWLGVYDALRRKLKLNPKYRSTYGLVAYNATLYLMEHCRDPYEIDVEEIDALNFEDSLERLVERCTPLEERLPEAQISARAAEAMSKIAMIDELERMIEKAVEREREGGRKPDWPRVVRKVLQRERERYRRILEREM